MRYRIAKQWRFEAAHQLAHLPADHQCSRLHGHSYRVEVALEWSGDIAAKAPVPGWVVDFGDLAPIGKMLAEHFDHQFLNEVFARLDYPFPTTSECLALVLWEMVGRVCGEEIGQYLSSVRVSETESTWAEVSR